MQKELPTINYLLSNSVQFKAIWTYMGNVENKSDSIETKENINGNWERDCPGKDQVDTTLLDRSVRANVVD